MKSHNILYTRKNNENLTSAFDPYALWTGQVDLSETGTFCASSDWDMLVTGNLYEVRSVSLPDWLSPTEWLRDYVAWKYVWGAGVDMSWPESWQRGLASLHFGNRYAACTILKVKKFRSEFRAKMRDQIVQWLETPADKRQYQSPLSSRQWECIQPYNRREIKYAEERLYRDRSEMGKELSKEQALAAV